MIGLFDDTIYICDLYEYPSPKICDINDDLIKHLYIYIYIIILDCTDCI